MSDVETEAVAQAMCRALKAARRPVRHTAYEMRIMSEAARSAMNTVRDVLPPPSPYGDLCPPAAPSLRDELLAAGVGGWRGALGADLRPLFTGMEGELAENVTIAGDYLPVRLVVGTPIRVDGIIFDKREDWCVVELIYPHRTGLRRARVRCNAVRG